MKKTKDETKKETKAATGTPDGKAAATSLLNDLLNTANSGESKKQCADESASAKDPFNKIAEDIMSALSSLNEAGALKLPLRVKIGFGFPDGYRPGEAHCGKDESDHMAEIDPYEHFKKALPILSPKEALYDMASTDVEILTDTQIPELQRILLRLECKQLPLEAITSARAYLEALRNLREKAEELLAKIDLDDEMAEDEEDEESEEE